MQETKIIIMITPGEPGEPWRSSHEIIGLDERTAAIILIDIGRNLLAALSLPHTHEETKREDTHGH